jgi:hypothetical protein
VQFLHACVSIRRRPGALALAALAGLDRSSAGLRLVGPGKEAAKDFAAVSAFLPDLARSILPDMIEH